MTQKEALNILKTGANVFLTGEPGSGKTHTVNSYVKWLREHGIQPSVTASTGIAATHIGGYTIHSWAGLGIRDKLTEYDLDQMGTNERLVKRLNSARVLIIDEVSMLSSQMLSMVDQVCRALKDSNRAFGGLQVVLVGDFFQLPPVRDRFAFYSSSWEESSFIVCYLSEQHRQEDGAFLNLLGAIRRGEVNEDHIELLNSRFDTKEHKDIPRLYSHNLDVDILNKHELDKLSINSRAFLMGSRGPENRVTQLKKGCLSPETLHLKVGARVMFTKNNFEEGFVNGTLGKVVGFSKTNGNPEVKTDKGKVIEVEKAEWAIEENNRVLASISQIPLRLAWAITIHKSQGMSLDSAHMDLSATFEYGQGYVALSRVRTFSGLILAGINKRALEVHPDIMEKDIRFKESSLAAQNSFDKLKTREITKMHDNFIRASEGKKPVTSKKSS
jgi:ATP-dependent exoDNAse (exonuclease V) alpha subunit